jgi:hypothetical protein
MNLIRCRSVARLFSDAFVFEEGQRCFKGVPRSGCLDSPEVDVFIWGLLEVPDQAING